MQTSPAKQIFANLSYTKNFQDPDGHIWELLYIDEAKIPKKGVTL